MSYKLKSLKKVENNKVKLDIEITNSHLKKSINRAYREISKKAKIPGFRKGKVPFNIIDINFGKEYVLNEAASISISELYPKIIEESGLKPIDYPKVKIIKVIKTRVAAKLVPELLQDLTPTEEYEKQKMINQLNIEKRDRGVGRPTKKDRRTISKLKDY